MIVYIDTCCYGRPTDDMKQKGVKAEADAIGAIVELCQLAGVTIIGSPTLLEEFDEIEQDDIREKVRGFYDGTVTDFIPASTDITLRAHDFAKVASLKRYDSFHLASAEAAGADYLLTTDKKFLKRAVRTNAAVKVINPINFLPEVERWVQ